MTTNNIPNRSLPAVSGVNTTLVLTFGSATALSARRVELINVTASFDKTPTTPAVLTIDRKNGFTLVSRTFMGVITTSGLAPIRVDGFMAAEGESLVITLNPAGDGITGYLSACAREF